MPGAARFGGRLQPALACATDPMVLGTRTVSALAELGKLLSEHGFPGEALPLLEGAQALGLDTPILGYLIGLCRVYTGEPERAEAELLACLRAEPGMPLALWAPAPRIHRPARRRRSGSAAAVLHAVRGTGPPRPGRTRLGRVGPRHGPAAPADPVRRGGRRGPVRLPGK